MEKKTRKNRQWESFHKSVSGTRCQEQVPAKICASETPPSSLLVTHTHRFPVLDLVLVTKLQIIDAVAIKEKYADDDDGYVVGGENIYM